MDRGNALLNLYIIYAYIINARDYRNDIIQVNVLVENRVE